MLCWLKGALPGTFFARRSHSSSKEQKKGGMDTFKLSFSQSASRQRSLADIFGYCKDAMQDVINNRTNSNWVKISDFVTRWDALRVVKYEDCCQEMHIKDDFTKRFHRLNLIQKFKTSKEELHLSMPSNRTSTSIFPNSETLFNCHLQIIWKSQIMVLGGVDVERKEPFTPNNFCNKKETWFGCVGGGFVVLFCLFLLSLLHQFLAIHRSFRS